MILFFVVGLTLAITGGQKQSDAALLPVRVNGVVRHAVHPLSLPGAPIEGHAML